MRSTRFNAAMLALLTSTAAEAGPPFTTDDPEPAPEDHYEIYLYSSGTHTATGWDTALPGFEINYGAGADLQIAGAVEQADEAPRGGVNHWHYGGLELGLKYRFVHEDDEGWRPQMSFYPSVELTEGTHAATTFLPLWLQKSIAGWDVFGGGGAHLNPGREHRNTWFTGVAALHPVSEHLELGGEIFHETADTHGEPAASGYNLAALYDLDETWHLVASAGRGIHHVETTNELSYYVGLEVTPP